MDDSNKFDDNFNKVWAILTEVARRQEQTEAQMAKTDKQMAETDKRLNELREQMVELSVQTAETDKRLNELREQTAETDKRLNELSVQTAETDKRLNELREQTAETDKRLNELREQTAETDKRLNKLMTGNESMQSFIKNDADACEQRFVESLDSNDLIVAGVKFYEIHSNVRKKLGGKNIELDALLINGDSVAIMEVKKKLHLNDVVKVRDNLIGRFRYLFPEHQAKRLLALVAGESINADAKDQALEAGFVVLSFKASELQMQTQQARYY